ncbi:hypothetical protein AB6A40_007115 [Gnathostoma spinigerum]|uniref:EGF-like domain-containing protein n=1 Tax=Gnathostoma spinigerum TaxID=75299 RepID=A0ABD6EKW0_9BILA
MPIHVSMEFVYLMGLDLLVNVQKDFIVGVASGTTRILRIVICSFANPCQHGGNSMDHAYGFECLCQIGYSGKRCEININDCSPKPCHNGGTCIDNISSYVCHCLPQFSSVHCQFRLDNPCTHHRCANNGVCKASADCRNYTCQCTSGFDGPFCEEDIDECNDGNPGLNGGSCVNKAGSYVCACRDGYSGHLCEVDRESCDAP